MKINVAEIKKHLGERHSFAFTPSAASLMLDDDCPFSQDTIRVEGEVVNNGGYLDVHGTIFFKGHFICDRCNAHFEKEMEAPFQEIFREEGAPTTAGDRDFTRYADDVIDLAEIIRETILMAEPIKKVCREDCRGLCPECGQNLNLSSCSCRREQIDPRLAVLKNLLDKK